MVPPPVKPDAPITPENLRVFGFLPEQIPNRVWYRLSLPPHPQLDTQQGLAFVVGVWQQGSLYGNKAWLLAVQLDVNGETVAHCPIVTLPLLLMGDLFQVLSAINIKIDMVSLETGHATEFKTSPHVPVPGEPKGTSTEANTVHSLPNDVLTRLMTGKNRLN